MNTRITAAPAVKGLTPYSAMLQKRGDRIKTVPALKELIAVDL